MEQINSSSAEIIEQALNKLNEEMSKPHSKSEDTIHNWLCDQTHDDELMKAILINGKTIGSALGYLTKKVKDSSKGQMAVLTDQEVFQLIRDYYLSLESKIEHDPSVKVLAGGEKVREVTKEVVKEIKVSVDKKSKQSIEAILKLEMSDADKLRLISSISVPEEVKKDEEDGELLSLFDL